MPYIVIKSDDIIVWEVPVARSAQVCQMVLISEVKNWLSLIWKLETAREATKWPVFMRVAQRVEIAKEIDKVSKKANGCHFKLVVWRNLRERLLSAVLRRF